MYKEIPGTGQIYLALSKESENIKENSRKIIKKEEEKNKLGIILLTSD